MNTALLDAAYRAGVKDFVFMSSGAIYPGFPMDRIWEESDAFTGDPSEVYYPVATMKRCTEMLCRVFADKLPQKTMRVLVIRPSNVYGPGDKFDPKMSHVTASLIKKVAERLDPLEVWGNGQDIRDVIYIDDFVEGVLAAVASERQPFEVYNICSGLGVSVNEILHILCELEGFHPRLVYSTDKPSTVPIRRLSPRRIRQAIDWSSQTPLVDGLSRTLAWYKEHPYDQD
jgi:GDP-L-fucose synthase